MTNLAAVLFLTSTLALPVSSATSDNPEAVAKAFLRAAYGHDMAQFNNLVFPRAGASVLLSTEAVAKERLEEIETETKSLRLKKLQPFRQLGKIVEAGPDGAYPDGTTTRYQTAFEGNLTVISLVKKEGRWLVDVRWWLKLREMSLRDEKERPDERELLIKTFLLKLLRLNRGAVSEFLVPGADINIVFEGAPRVPEPSDVLPSLAIEMPLVEAEAGEVYPLLSGRLVKKSAAGDETVMVGLFGPFEMVFLLRRVKGEWRIAPEPYYRIINR
ncbi:MAG: hypothetical protein AABO41_00560 [Acidobacteriota bacterium]